MFGNCSGHWVRTLNASFHIHFWVLFIIFFLCEHFWVLIVKKKKKERKKERDIKYNEKDTFTLIFNGEKGEVGNRGLTEITSGGLSDNF